MRILYFSFVELDVPNACQTHTLGVLKGFSRNGCKVDAVVPKPLSVKPKIINVEFYFIWPWQFSAIGKLYVKLFAGGLFFLLCLIKKYDAIYVRELDVNPFPRWCSQVYRIPLYIEINSILLKELGIGGSSRKTILRVERHQRKDLNEAKGLIVPSYPRKKWLVDHYKLNSEKVYVILNGVETDLPEKQNRRKTLRKLNLPENGFYLGYLGTVWEFYDLNGILEAIKLCNKTIPNLHLLIIGDGPKTSDLENLAKIIGISSQVHFLGYIQPTLLHEVMGAVDIGLMVMTRKGVEFGGPITTRFASYVFYNLPVIATDLYIERYPKDLQTGLTLVQPENCKELAGAIIEIYNNPKKTKEKVRVLKDFVMHRLTWDQVAIEILSIMKRDKRYIHKV